MTHAETPATDGLDRHTAVQDAEGACGVRREAQAQRRTLPSSVRMVMST